MTAFIRTATSSRAHNRMVYALLGLVLVAGFALRVWNINFDRGTGSHPDERSTACFYATRLKLPQSWEQLRDPHQSPLNPLWDLERQERRGFTYGHLPLYLGTAMGELFHMAAPLAERVGVPEGTVAVMARADESCDAIAVAGRFTIALFDTLTILLLFLLGRRVYGAWAGLLGATFYAFTAQAIQLSHFFAMDPASTTFTVWTVLAAAYMIQSRRWSTAVLTGVMAGLAIASKFSALPILAVPVVAGFLIFWDAHARRFAHDAAGDTSASAEDVGRTDFFAVAAPLLALILAFVAFFVTSPYAVLDWANFAQATLVEQGQMVRGVADFPFTRQYRNTTPYLYFIQQQVTWGLGPLLGTVAIAGVLGALAVLLRTLYALAATTFDHLRGRPTWRAVDNAAAGELLAWSWLIPYFGLTGAFLAKFNRYMIPVLPFVLLFAAGLVWRLWRGREDVMREDVKREDVKREDVKREDVKREDVEREGLVRVRRGVGVVLALVGVFGGLFWSLAYVNGVYGREHTWLTASRWMYENAPAGSVILWELWDDPLPKTVPGEPGMDMGSAGLRNIDWSPYEEDTAEKYAVLKEKLREADFVAYSSKRIYDSVDELPERYPMTNRYYQAMWDGTLGFELAAEFTSPPQLLGMTFDDRHADESWSLYDHPQVTIFRKVRDLSDAEFDAVLGGSWEGAIPWYRGKDSPLSPLLTALGLGSSPDAAEHGALSRLIGRLSGKGSGPAPEARPSLVLEQPLDQLPVVDNYRWNVAAGNNAALAIGWWWLVVSLLGWVAWPLLFPLSRTLRDRGYLVARTFGWLLPGWLLWWLASMGVLTNTVRNSWLIVGALALVAVVLYAVQRRAVGEFVGRQWPLLLVGEALYLAAFLGFIVVRMANPDLWQPWFGGEKFMEFAFLNGILRSPTFPPVDPHFAGGFINYYYFGIYLVAFLTKLTGIYAEVAFNLAIPMIFAMTAVNAFAAAYSAQVRWWRRGEGDGPRWHVGLAPALLGPLFVAVLGNLDGFAQIVRGYAGLGTAVFNSSLPGLTTAVRAASGLSRTVSTGQPAPAYDFWGPSRVLPFTINEFPYWSFLYADLHPHLIGIPLALFFLVVVLMVLGEFRHDWMGGWPRSLGLIALLGLLLGTLASVNLWELPTYFGLGVLAFMVSLYRGRGRIPWAFLLTFAAGYLFAALLFFFPFFRNYHSVAASGVGFVKAGDPLGLWLLIWGLFAFVLVSWLLYITSRRMTPTAVVLGGPSPDGTSETVSAVESDDILQSDNTLETSDTVETGDTVASDRTAEASSFVMSAADEIGDTVVTVDSDEADDLGDADVVLQTRDVGETADAPATRAPAMSTEKPTGMERLLSLFLRRYDRLPRMIDLHRKLVRRPTFGYVLGAWLLPLALLAAVAAIAWDRTVLALCLPFLALATLMLWRRSAQADPGTLFATLLTATGLAVLAGTQVVYLKDFLQGGEWYRMNTLFKFFSQVWVIWGVAAAVALPQAWQGIMARADTGQLGGRLWRLAWSTAAVVLVALSLSYTILGTPARLDQRFVGWRPAFGTLNALDFMRQGVYTWPDESNPIELRYDWEAIQWLLDNVHGNPVVVESAEVEYYRAGGSRVASLTGMSGLRGMHAGEQRYGEEVGRRDGLHREFWGTPDIARTQQLMDELDVALIYVGQLEQRVHPDGVRKLAEMADAGLLTVIYANERVTIYAVPGALVQTERGSYVPS